jgi:hypothetical protein
MKTTKNRQIFIPAIGWRFEVPNKLSFNDSAFNKQGKLTEAIPDDGSSIRLLVTKSDRGSFAAYIWKDTLDAKEWKDYHDKDTDWYFSQMRQLTKMKVLDTKYSNEKVGNIDFLVQYVKYINKSTNDTGYTYHYFGKLKETGMDISFEYYDKQLGKSYHDILNSSSFQN